MIHHWWLYGSKWPSPTSPKKEIKSPIKLKFFDTLAARSRKTIWLPQIKYLQSELFFFVWDLYYLFLYMEFSSSTWKKSPPPKVSILIKNPNLTYVPPIWTFWKLTPHPITKGEWGWGLQTINKIRNIPSHLQYFDTLQHSRP